MTALIGLDIHGGLRIRFERNGYPVRWPPSAEVGTLTAVYSAESGTDVVRHVAEYIDRLRARVQYAEAWLEQYREQPR